MLRSGIFPRALRRARGRLRRRGPISAGVFQNHLWTIAALYRVVLGRPPDAAFVGGWIDQLDQGRGIEQIAAEFIASSEFRRRNAGRNTRLVLLDNARAAGGAMHGRIDHHSPAAVAATLVRQIAAMPPPLLRDVFPGGVPFGDGNFYNIWLAALASPGSDEREAMRAASLPVISFIMLTDRAKPEWRAAAIASVAGQTCSNVELIAIGKDAPEGFHAAGVDRRFIQASGSASTAALFNRALAACRGDFAVWIGRHDVLSQTAAYEIGCAGRDAEIVCADEDQIDPAGRRHSPSMGGAWDADALLGTPCPGIAAIRVGLLRARGGLREDIPGAEEWDMVLRASTGVPSGRIKRVASILVSRRDPSARPAPPAVRQRVVQDYLSAAGMPQAKAECQRDLPVRVVHALAAEPPLVSIIIPTRDRPALLKSCLDGVLKGTDYPSLEVLVIDNGSTDAEALAILQRAAADVRVRVLRAPGPFNWSALNNTGVAAARGAVVVLLNNDVEMIEPGWLRELVSQAMRPDVGIVGAKLLYRDGSIQHAGIVLGPIGRATHIWRHAAGGQLGYLSQLAKTRQVAALTGACLALRRAVYLQLGGLAEQLAVTWSDVDLCLRVRSAGLRVVWTPHACLLHPEQSTRGPDSTPEAEARLGREQAWMIGRWGEALGCDPFVSANMVAVGRELLLATVPLADPFWRARSRAEQPKPAPTVPHPASVFADIA